MAVKNRILPLALLDNVYSKCKAKNIKSCYQFLFCPTSYISGQFYIAVTLSLTWNSKQPQTRDVNVKIDLGNTGHFISSCGDEVNGRVEVS